MTKYENPAWLMYLLVYVFITKFFPASRSFVKIGSVIYTFPEVVDELLPVRSIRLERFG